MNLTPTMIGSFAIEELCNRFGDHADESVRLFAVRLRREFLNMGDQRDRAKDHIDDLENEIETLKERIQDFANANA